MSDVAIAVPKDFEYDWKERKWKRVDPRFRFIPSWQ